MAVGEPEHIVEEAIVLVPQLVIPVADAVHGGGDPQKMLVELEGQVQEGRIVDGQLRRNLEHALAVEGHPGRAVGLLERPAGGQGRAAIEDADVVEAEEASLEDVEPAWILPVHPPGEVDDELLEDLLQEIEVSLAALISFLRVDVPGSPGVHGRIDVAEVPLVGGDLAARMEILLLEHEEELLLGEGEIHQGQGDGVEGEIPRRVPRVLPLVGHGDDVLVRHVGPRPVAHPEQPRVARIEATPAQPLSDVVVVILLRPQHPGQSLPHDQALVGAHLGGRDGSVEGVRLLLARAERRVEVPTKGAPGSRRRRGGQPQAHHRGGPRLHGERVVGGHLGAGVRRAHRLAVVVHDVAVDRVLGVWRAIGRAGHALAVRLVLGVKKRHAALAREGVLAPFRVAGHRRAHAGRPVRLPERRSRRVSRPRPRVAEPQGGQEVEGGGLGPAVRHRETDQDVLGRRLGVFHEDVEVAVAVEDSRVEQLVLHLVAVAAAVGPHEVVVRVGLVRILVEVLHVGVGGGGVEVEVVLLDVLAVVALAVGQAEEALLDDGIGAIPEGEGEAEPLAVVGDSGEAVLAPAVGARPRLIVAEVVPGVTRLAVVLTDRPPLALREVGAPLLPGGARLGGLLEAALFAVHRRSLPGRGGV